MRSLLNFSSFMFLKLYISGSGMAYLLSVSTYTVFCRIYSQIWNLLYIRNRFTGESKFRFGSFGIKTSEWKDLRLGIFFIVFTTVASYLYNLGNWFIGEIRLIFCQMNIKTESLYRHCFKKIKEKSFLTKCEYLRTDINPALLAAPNARTTVLYCILYVFAS
jgi:hypothetical protein